MKALVCIDNNLQNDSRLKRHVSALAEVYHQVHVLARPIPNHVFGIKKENVLFSFYEERELEYPITSKLRKLLKEWELLEIISFICPIIQSDDYYQLNVMKHFIKDIDEKLQGDRWKEIRERKEEQMELQPAISYVMSFLKNSIFMAEQALQVEADVIICNDVDTLLCGVIHKKKYNSRLIYDIHDITCDLSPNIFPLIYSEILMNYEKELIQYADCVIGVGDYLLNWVRKHYGLFIPCIPIYSCNQEKFLKNVPKKRINIEKNIRLYFHGAAFPARKLENVIYAIKKVEGFDLVIRSEENTYLKGIKEIIKMEHLEHRVLFLELVSTQDILKATNQDGDIGIYVTDPYDCVNWMASFTNKFMEYLGAGLPIITTKAVDQAKIVNQYKCGFILEDDSVDSIERILQYVLCNRDKLNMMANNSWKVGRTIFDWSKYKQYFLGAVQGDISIINQSKLPDLMEYERCIIQIWKNEDFMIHRLGVLEKKLLDCYKNGTNQFLEHKKEEYLVEATDLFVEQKNKKFDLYLKNKFNQLACKTGKKDILINSCYEIYLFITTIFIYNTFCNNSSLAWFISMPIIYLLNKIGIALVLRLSYRLWKSKE